MSANETKVGQKKKRLSLTEGRKVPAETGGTVYNKNGVDTSRIGQLKTGSKGSGKIVRGLDYNILFLTHANKIQNVSQQIQRYI